MDQALWFVFNFSVTWKMKSEFSSYILFAHCEGSVMYTCHVCVCGVCVCVCVCMPRTALIGLWLSCSFV